MRKLLFVLAFLSLSVVAQAQSNYCDTTPPTTGTGTTNAPEVVTVCQNNKDTGNNNVNVTAWTLYDTINGVTTPTPITMTKGTTSTVSGATVYTGSFTSNVVGQHSLQITATGNGLESVKSAAFLLTLSNPPSAPQAPFKLSTQ